MRFICVTKRKIFRSKYPTNKRNVLNKKSLTLVAGPILRAIWLGRAREALLRAVPVPGGIHRMGGRSHRDAPCPGPHHHQHGRPGGKLEAPCGTPEAESGRGENRRRRRSATELAASVQVRFVA